MSIPEIKEKALLNICNLYGTFGNNTFTITTDSILDPEKNINELFKHLEIFYEDQKHY